jgi:hypothetical protein
MGVLWEADKALLHWCSWRFDAGNDKLLGHCCNTLMFTTYMIRSGYHIDMVLYTGSQVEIYHSGAHVM